MLNSIILKKFFSTMKHEHFQKINKKHFEKIAKKHTTLGMLSKYIFCIGAIITILHMHYLDKNKILFYLE